MNMLLKLGGKKKYIYIYIWLKRKTLYFIKYLDKALTQSYIILYAFSLLLGFSIVMSRTMLSIKVRMHIKLYNFGSELYLDIL